MSDSELSDAPSSETPPDSEIEASLRREVKTAAKGPLEDYTVSKIRKATEKSLGLPEGFFKGDEKWKVRSKNIIEKQVEIENTAASNTPVSQPEKKRPIKPTVDTKKPAKRPSPNESRRASKKQKVESDRESSALSSAHLSEEDFSESEKPKKGKKDVKKVPVPKAMSKPKAKSEPKTKAKAKASDSENDLGKNGPEEATAKEDGSESEMSVVLDEPLAKKPRGKGITSDTADKKSKTSTSKPKASTDTNPDEEEIKKLKNWLAKCGIRKVWGKELKPYTSDKAKIKYLRDMLAEVGMTGRYSNEKAAQIKEARELAADIEAVQEGNERWGKSDDENGDGDGDGKTRGGRRLVRGAKNYDFLSSDGEETD